MTRVEHHRGDLLSADAEALVNTVNTVGVMGKGVALQFRQAFPANYKAYRRAYERGELQPGKMFVFETNQPPPEPRLIINFPTKQHWRGKAKMEYIDAGLVDLVAVLRRYSVRSVAIPPLGCGNGGLRWQDVRPRIEAAMAPLTGVRVALYGPSGAPSAHKQRVATKKPRMTRGRATLIAAFAAYRKDPTAALTLRAAQKLAYLMQVAGEPLKLDFAKAEYGPYAEVLNHALQSMEGHYIEGYGDRTAASNLYLLDGAEPAADKFLSSHAGVDERVKRVERLIEGFESPLGLELLTTVHWAATRDGAKTPEEAVAIVAAWTERKREVFGEREVAIAWKRLELEGWLDEDDQEPAQLSLV